MAAATKPSPKIDYEKVRRDVETLLSLEKPMMDIDTWEKKLRK